MDDVSGRPVVVFAGGLAPSPRVVEMLPEDAWVFAADSGYDHARALGVEVDLLIGDLDSISAEGLALAEEADTPIAHHPSEKDATDLALALLATRDAGARRVTVVAGDGGRLDHLMTSVLALTEPDLAAIDIDAWIGTAWVRPLHGPGAAPLAGRLGELVTLLAVGGPAEGITTEGLTYPLCDETLIPGSTRGVSNVFEAGDARVSLRQGCLLIVRPEALA